MTTKKKKKTTTTTRTRTTTSKPDLGRAAVYIGAGLVELGGWLLDHPEVVTLGIRALEAWRRPKLEAPEAVTFERCGLCHGAAIPGYGGLCRQCAIGRAVGKAPS